MNYVRSALRHPQTEGKIERWHQALKNRILIKNYSFPSDLQENIGVFLKLYNKLRYHKSIANLAPADI